MDERQIDKTLKDHSLWLQGKGGARADLQGADLQEADLQEANLQGANLHEVNLRWADLHGANLQGSNLHGANLHGADLQEADLQEADLRGANLRWADLHGANLRGADLLCLGNMQQVKTLQFDTWEIGYTKDTLQIGCQTHSIDKWERWNTKAGHKWVDSMDETALEWAEKYLDLVLEIVATSPATE